MFNASDVKTLREKTGAGMLDCKKALDACEGNIEKAVDWLREKGIAKAAKKSDRIAAEGLAQIYVKGNHAVVVEVNCETDFVAKNEEFKALVDKIGNALLESGITSDKDALELKVGNETVNDLIIALTSKLGEKISLRRLHAATKEDDWVFGTYIHMGGKIASLVAVKGNDEEVARNVAMQAAAMRPLYAKASYVPSDVLEKEKEIMRQELLNEGKPADKIENILVGKVRKYYEEVCLEDQVYIKAENKETVKDYLEKNNSSLEFMVRFEVGEGMEKRNENFADEVMSQING